MSSMQPFSVEQKRGKRTEQTPWRLLLTGLAMAVLIVAVIAVLAGEKHETEASLTVIESAERGRGESGVDRSANHLDDAGFAKWYRTVSEIKWFGSPTRLAKGRPMDKTQYLTRPDCAAAEDAGVVHITKDCLFTCEACEGSMVRIQCNTLSAGHCDECAEIGCPPAHFRVGCGGLLQGTCETCGQCGLGYFREGCEGTEPGACRRCHDCGLAQWNRGCGGLEPGECEDCPACQVDFYRAGCGGVSVGRCEACQPCGESEYELRACAARSDRTCAACGSLLLCGAGQYRAECGHGNPGSCVACPPCPVGAFRADCGDLSLGECRACPDCGDGGFVAGCTGTSAGQCADCQDCPEESYRSGCRGWEGGECAACKVCGAEEYEGRACAGREDRECGRCESLGRCGEGMVRRGCGHGAAGQCEACGACPVGEFRVGCGGRGEGECVACGACPEGRYREGCAGMSAGACEACQECGEGTVLQGCGGLHRGVCVECEALPCPEGKTRLGCGGAEEGRCEWAWGSATPPPVEVVWGAHATAAECVVFDAPMEGAGPEAEWTAQQLVRLGGCGRGQASGRAALPWRGAWRVSFFVGVPRFQAGAKPSPASYPWEGKGKPDRSDTLTVTINGKEETVENFVGDQDGSKLVVVMDLAPTREVDFAFAFRSSNAEEELHMFASNAEATFLGDGLWREWRLQQLGGGTGLLTARVMNACDGKTLVPLKHVSDGYEGKLFLPDEEGEVRLLLGSAAVELLRTRGGVLTKRAVPAAPFACEATYPGFYSYFDPACSVRLGQLLERPMPLCPFLNPGHGRFILTWGASPADMDLMITVPTGRGDGQTCMIDYKHRYCQDRRVRLDYDEIKAYGPETITIEGFIPGKYVVHVRHFGGHRFVSRRTNLDPMVGSSMAMVTYYTGQNAQRFEVGHDGYQEREDWMVLAVDGATGAIQRCTPELCPRPRNGF